MVISLPSRTAAIMPHPHEQKLQEVVNSLKFESFSSFVAALTVRTSMSPPSARPTLPPMLALNQSRRPIVEGFLVEGELPLSLREACSSICLYVSSIRFLLRLTEGLELMIRISAAPSQVSSQRYEHGIERRLAILTVTFDSRRGLQGPSNIHAVRAQPPLAEPRRSRSRYDGCHFLAVCTATANPRARQQSLCWHRRLLDSSGDILRWPAVDAGRRVSCQ